MSRQTDLPSESELDPIDQHRRNVMNLRGPCIAVASYPGAGAAYLGNILLALGPDYVDPYTEVLDHEGRARPAAARVDYRRRLAASAERDVSPAPPTPGNVRFVKTHLLPEDFPRPRAVVVLVRDPRDTLHSYYHWRLGFSEEGENRSFPDFLRSIEPFGRRPVDDWTRFHTAWLEVLPHYPHAIVCFEHLKTAPLPELRLLFCRLDLAVPDDESLSVAVEASSFEAMRRHEEAIAGSDQRRVMRRGQPGEWTEWYHGEIVDSFADPALRVLAGELGYQF